MAYCEGKGTSLDYYEKLILAPMVRQGTLPFRSLCLDYGADIVYSEEIIDIKLMQCQRLENPMLNTVDFVLDDEVVFRTHDSEKSRVVIQIGTANPQQAVKVAELVHEDVAGLDINMGCPKDYSVKGGMGAALLKDPDLIEGILRQVRASFSKPLTCKIRLLNNLEDTLKLVKRIESTGVNAIGVHGRTKDERPNHPNNNSAIRAIAASLSIPVIANGGSSSIRCYEDIEKFRLETGAASVMVARSAQANPSIFRKDGPLSSQQMILDYLKKAIDFNGSYRSTKYSVQHLFGDTSTEQGQLLLGTRDIREMCEVFQFEKYFDEKRTARGIQPTPGELFVAECGNQAGEKRHRGDLQDVFSENLDYTPISKKLKKLNSTHTPKSVLLEYCVSRTIPSASFDIVHNGRTFSGSVTVEGKTYTNTAWHKTKKDAEQAATVVALKHLIPGFQV